MNFTKQELAKLYDYLHRLLPLTARPVGVNEIPEISALILKTMQISASIRSEYERGEKVFEWRIPREQAPTLNIFAAMKGWQKKRLWKELDRQVSEMLSGNNWPNANLFGARTKRWVRVTRFSIKQVDEVSVDILGGKMPIDCLVRAGILTDDNQEFLHREARWEKTKVGNSHLLVEVFECAVDEVPAELPSSEIVTQMKRKQEGFFTLAIREPSRVKGRRAS